MRSAPDVFAPGRRTTRGAALGGAVLLAVLLVPSGVALAARDDAATTAPGAAPDASAPPVEGRAEDGWSSGGASSGEGSGEEGPLGSTTADPGPSTAARRPSPSASPSPSTTPSPAVTPRPSPPGQALGPAPDAAVVGRGDGVLAVVPGTDAAVGEGTPVRYLVEVEGGIGADADAFAAQVHEVLSDPRGWSAGSDGPFERVGSGPVAFRVALASPGTTDELCLPLRTVGQFSCEVGLRATINSRRWLQGADAYGDDLLSYREYVVSHEVGHALGLGHVYGCDDQGRARTMQQQTKGLAGCSANPWPFPDAAVG